MISWRNHLSPGPVLASAGPDWKHFCQAPLNPVATGALVGLSPPNKAPSPKLKHETLNQ